MVKSNYLQSRSIKEMVLCSGVISVALPRNIVVLIVNVSTGSLSSSSMIVVFRHILVSEVEVKTSVIDPNPSTSSTAVDDIQVNFSAHQCGIIAIDLHASPNLVPNDWDKKTAMGFAAAGSLFSTTHDSMNPSVSVYTKPPGRSRLTSTPSSNYIHFLWTI